MTTSSDSSHPPAPDDAAGNGTLSDLILPLKPSFRPSDFERIMQTLTARDEAARRDTALWKSKHDAMEKKHDETVLGKLIALDMLAKLKREHDRERELLQNQAARAENDRRRLVDRTEEDRKRMMDRFKEDEKAGRERERNWEERYARLWEDFEKAETEKARLVCRVSVLEFESEKAAREAEESKRRSEDLNRRVSRLEEDAAMLMREERSDVAAAAAATAADELVVDGRAGGRCGGGDGSSDEDLAELLPVKDGGGGGEKAEEAPGGGSTGPPPGFVEIGTGGGGYGSSFVEAQAGMKVEDGTGSVVVITIDDSDDDMPSRKRRLPNDVSEGEQPAKKKSLEELLDMPAGSDSSDTVDDSSSDSEIKSEIARLCSKVAEKKTWAFKADMMSALDREPELCMNAVCTLYRKQLCKMDSVGGSSVSMNEGFYPFDAFRGTRLGKYLTDGDPQGKLKRSVSELQKFDPNGLDECRKLAHRHSDRLFEIYQKKQDAFFPPS